MTPSNHETFNRNFSLLEKHLNLKGMRPKTKDSYMRGVRQIAEYFDYDIIDLSEQQLLDYFNDLLGERSWSTLKHQLYGLKFFYKHVLNKPWEYVDLIEPPKAEVLPDIVSVAEAMRLFNETRILSYKVFFFTLYSLGLRLGEGVQLRVGDIDTAHRRVHVRNAKGNKDRWVPLPATTLTVLRRFWSVHRHPTLLFPNRKRGLSGVLRVDTPLDRGGVQQALRKVSAQCGFKKRLPLTH
ncbi:tyrosine-type recombinase/integrase [Pseudomonadota bacterium]